MDQLSLLLSQTLLIAVPLVLAALAGVSSERAGVVNIALEGVLLAGAFTGAALGFASGSVTLGLAGGVLGGALLSLLHAALSVHVRADQIISGLALNLFAAGATEYLSRLYWPANSARALPPLPRFTLTQVDLVDTLLGRPLVLLTALLVAGAVWLVRRSVAGLRQHAVGENPHAALALGVDVVRVRYLSVLLSGALAGLGGAYLAFNVGQFQHGMSAGKGYIAMGAVVFGRWTPGGAAAACLLFAFAESLAAACERWRVPVPSELIGTLPYVLTVLALIGVGARARAPAALGRPFER